MEVWWLWPESLGQSGGVEMIVNFCLVEKMRLVGRHTGGLVGSCPRTRTYKVDFPGSIHPSPSRFFFYRIVAAGPAFGPAWNGSSLPWDPSLRSMYFQVYGVTCLPNLPDLACPVSFRATNLASRTANSRPQSSPSPPYPSVSRHCLYDPSQTSSSSAVWSEALAASRSGTVQVSLL